MHPADITAALKKVGSSQARVAARLGLTRQAVNHVVNGSRRTTRIRRAISRTTGIPVGQLWPERANATPESHLPALGAGQAS